jgi:uncharacterized protein YecE (DUF72 family)
MQNKPRLSKGIIRIGISNVHIPGNKSSFPPEFQSGSRLNYYSSIFNTVEVNSCFYKTPQLKTYERWRLDVPEDFQFTLKLSKEISHAPGLENDLSCMEGFLKNATGTGNKKGCLLIQFPGRISLEHFQKVENILMEAERLDPQSEWRIAVEFRNDSWYKSETRELLDEFSAAMVVHDFKKGKNPELRGRADFAYVRFHGPEGDYRGSYTDEYLAEKARMLSEWAEQGKDVYVYFNNTAGNAFENAMRLKEFCKQP